MPFEEDVPESMLGCILAFESIDGAHTIVNGPTGCKYPPAAQSEELFLRDAQNPFRFMDRYYFGQPRVPCTYMDSDDLILGTDDKLRELGEKVLSGDPDMVGIVNSPGAALIGSKLDVLDGKGIPIVTMENPGYSRTFGDGYQDTMIAVLEKICRKKERVKGTVNVIGMSIRDLSWRDDIDEIGSMLSDCGIKVNAFIGAGCTVKEIEDSASAEYNILLHRNLGSRIADWYHDVLSIPTLDFGLPLGFDAIEGWVKGICDVMGKDPSKVLEKLAMARRRTANEIKHINHYTQLPSGYTFSISSEGPLAYHLMDSLYNYLGMMPVALDVQDDSYDMEISHFIGSNDLEISDDVFNTGADIFFGSATLSADLLFRGVVEKAVNIMAPRMNRASIKRRPLLGIDGTMDIIDEVVNSADRIR